MRGSPALPSALVLVDPGPIGPRPQTVEFFRGLLRELKPDLEVGITVGAGHFHQIEVPGQVNAMIERFFALSL